MSRSDRPFDTMSLGELIDSLEAAAQLAPGRDVGFDFLGMVPVRIDSYRGFYDHLALEPGNRRMHSADAPVEKVLQMLKEAVGGTFHGYKGGVYRMTRETPVWCAFHGDTGSRITDVCVGEYSIQLLTEPDDA